MGDYFLGTHFLAGHVLQNTTNITLLGSYSLTKEWPFPTRVGSDVQYETSKVFVLTGIERPEELAEQCPSALQCKYGCTKLPFGALPPLVFGLY